MWTKWEIMNILGQFERKSSSIAFCFCHGLNAFGSYVGTERGTLDRGAAGREAW